MIRMRSPEFLGSLTQISTEWSRRVVQNGGPKPSTNTILAMDTFLTDLTTSGLLAKMHSVCVFVPDSLIAATTPLIVGIGADPWINNGFTASHLNAEGLLGGSPRYLDTGVKAKAGSAVNSITGNVGMTVVITETDGNGGGTNIGHQDSTIRQLLLIAAGIFSAAGQTYYTSNSSTGGFNVVATDWNRVGYVSGNTVAGAMSVYEASPLRSHALLSSTAAATSATLTNETIYCFASNSSGIGATAFRASRMSFAAVHDGLSISESATFSSLIQTLRTTIGSGTGDEIEAWANRSVTLGGTAIATSTKSALRTFYAGLVSNSLLSKMVAANCVVPDNLLAARQPLIWNAGNELWTNNNFVDGDLTVNGLVSAGSPRYLSTGIVNSTAQILTNDSGGISAMVYSATQNGAQLMGGTTGAGSTHFTLTVPTAGNAINFYCWGFSGASGANWLTANYPGSSFPGFISGNRTASNAIAIYTASTATAFSAAGTGAGARTQARFAVQMLAWAAAQNSVPTPGAYVTGTISFMATHGGLSSTEANNLYDLVAAMRTALGGGNP